MEHVGNLGYSHNSLRHDHGHDLDHFERAVTGSDGPGSASFLEAIDGLQQLVESMNLDASSFQEQQQTAFDEAQSLMQTAMSRMEDEFRSMLEHHSEAVDSERLYQFVSMHSFASISMTSTPDDSFATSSAAAAALEDSAKGEGNGEDEVATSRSLSSRRLVLDILPADIIPELRNIAVRMVKSGYKTECCQVYIQIRKLIMEENLLSLGIEKHTIEDVQRMPWETLESEILKWMKAVEVFVQVLFPSEMDMCQQIFDDMPDVSEWCFGEIGKGAMAQLLNFAEAVAICRRSPEKLPRILDMYEKLRDSLEEINILFCSASCETLRSDAAGILQRLGEAARGTFAEFANAIKRDQAKNPVPGGAVHPLTRYVMNYLRLLSCFTDTLNEILGSQRSIDLMPTVTDQGSNPGSPYNDRLRQQRDELPLSTQTHLLMNLLEDNLDRKSKLYKDTALMFLFLMNNYQYIVQKVKASEVRTLLSDDWLRRHMAKVRQSHNGYLRSGWTKVLQCIRDEGIHSGGSSYSGGVSRSVLKERFRAFNTAFDEIIKTQQSWIVSDPQLCADLRISIIEFLLPAYRAFLGRFRGHLESERHPERYLRYTAEDLEGQLNDLFDEGTSVHRRGSFSTN